MFITWCPCPTCSRCGPHVSFCLQCGAPGQAVWACGDACQDDGQPRGACEPMAGGGKGGLGTERTCCHIGIEQQQLVSRNNWCSKRGCVACTSRKPDLSSGHKGLSHGEEPLLGFKVLWNFAQLKTVPSCSVAQSRTCCPKEGHSGQCHHTKEFQEFHRD